MKKILLLALCLIFLGGCNKDKILITTLTKQTVRITENNTLIITENSKNFEYKNSDISRIGYASVPYNPNPKENPNDVKFGTGLLIQTKDEKNFQLLIQENSDIVNILKNSGFTVMEAFVLKE